MVVIKNNKILKYLLMMVVSLLLVLNFSIGVSASSNYDRQEADACITISGRLTVKGGSGTVWDKITSTQENYNNTSIPKSFEIDVNGQKMWVHGNASEHIYEDVYKGLTVGSGTAHTNSDLYSQILLSDFHGSLENATKNGITYGEMIAEKPQTLDL